MFKIIKADKDTYITNKIVKSERKTKSNVGCAGTLDLFKLYGITSSGSFPNTEFSRLLVHYDLSEVKQLVNSGKININDSSFWCKLKLKDVYGGQPTPSDFSVDIFPLSGSFSEGAGKDVRYYSDRDVCNWLSSSATSAWFVSGCGKSCDAQLGGGDYITSSLDVLDTRVTQYFKTGEEDLEVDVTKIVSSTLAGHIPDAGFRISFTNSEEVDNQTYFVKRFAAKNAYDESKHPTLMIGFDDSVEDDSQNLTFDYSGNLTLYNRVGGVLTNIVSSSIEITGSSCMTLKMMMPVSGGYYDLQFSASQITQSPGSTISGSYASTILIPTSDPVVSAKLQTSSSITFLPVWQSLDGTVAYVTGSSLTVRKPDRTSSTSPKNYVVRILNVKEEYSNDEEMHVKLNVFDHSSPLIKVVKLPVELPGIVVKNAFYQVRDTVTGEVIVPFDFERGSTKISSDSMGMFFKMNASNFLIGRSYVIDVAILDGYSTIKFNDASPSFRVVLRNTL